ncbi:hypothetical protein PHO31112_05385 [Pandoraea horticolens]|uniref:Phage-related membrane protein n=1 Tax=Pandoraea horticolens TaxID=2508298 RepID=A0A5E4ZE49_9BURK|nr:hypothetical protein [Pandoraea horticolens]VVE58812.1 hypothetical protein PHO31112_05385 [Pandoraea horticolens]
MKEALQHLRSIATRTSLGITLGTASCLAKAESGGGGSPDLSSLTNGISMGSTTAAILAVALSLVTVYATLRGAKIVLGVIKG